MNVNWLQPEMNGTDEGVMKALKVSIPEGSANSQQADVMRSYMAELWARGISKEDFVKWAKEGETKCQ